MKLVKTKILDCTDESINLILKILKRGGVVGVPTETVYGLVGDAFCSASIERIFKIKKRDKDKALICNISDFNMISKLTDYNSLTFEKIIKKFWPGPLTVVVEKNKKVLDLVTGGKDTVAIRCSSNEFLKKLTKLFGGPLVIPSANISGNKSKTNILDVYEELNGKVEILVKSNYDMYGVESTIIKLDGQNIKILREGVITSEEIKKFLFC